MAGGTAAGRTALATTAAIISVTTLAVAGWGYRDVKIYQRRARVALPMQPHGMALLRGSPEVAKIARQHPAAQANRTSHWDGLNRLDDLVLRLEWVMILSAAGCLISGAVVAATVVGARNVGHAAGDDASPVGGA